MPLTDQVRGLGFGDLGVGALRSDGELADAVEHVSTARRTHGCGLNRSHQSSGRGGIAPLPVVASCARSPTYVRARLRRGARRLLASAAHELVCEGREIGAWTHARYAPPDLSIQLRVSCLTEPYLRPQLLRARGQGMRPRSGLDFALALDLSVGASMKSTHALRRCVRRPSCGRRSSQPISGRRSSFRRSSLTTSDHRSVSG